MTGRASRRKGADAERDVVAHLIANGFIHAERRLSGGINDRGDITGLPGVVLEVKNHKEINLASFMRQLSDEMETAKAETGACIIKRRGTGDVGQWYAVLTFDNYIDLLTDAGWRPSTKGQE